MVSITDRVAVPPLAGAADAIAQAAAPAAVLAPAVSLAAGERELRIDLFRGLALWLIFIDHLSPDLLTWFTIRSYGFSDAAEIFFATISSDNPFYSQEMRVVDFLKQPGVVLLQTLLLRFRPLNIDVLPLYVVLMFFLPVILWLMKWKADATLALSVAFYALTLHYDWYLSAYPDGYWAFNPLAWQLLFVFAAWCALGGARRMSRIVLSPITQGICFAYLLAAFCVTMTWYFPQLSVLMPRRLEQWMYPIDKIDLDVLRFAHFLALAAITVRFVPNGWRHMGKVAGNCRNRRLRARRAAVATGWISARRSLT